jgi:hypothetical protein
MGFSSRQRIAIGRSLLPEQEARGWPGRIEGLGDAKRPDDDLLFFKRVGGGWPRLNQMFGGELDGVLQQFQREVRAA